jgi:hypothetical protein
MLKKNLSKICLVAGILGMAVGTVIVMVANAKTEVDGNIETIEVETEDTIIEE